jgi:DnaJ-class molecular chaperone
MKKPYREMLGEIKRALVFIKIEMAFIIGYKVCPCCDGRGGRWNNSRFGTCPACNGSRIIIKKSFFGNK